jgi:hypothetical protein
MLLGHPSVGNLHKKAIWDEQDILLGRPQSSTDKFSAVCFKKQILPKNVILKIHVH